MRIDIYMQEINHLTDAIIRLTKALDDFNSAKAGSGVPASPLVAEPELMAKEIGETLSKSLASAIEEETSEVVANEIKDVSLTEVKEVLMKLKRIGKGAVVKNLITGVGAKKLSEVDASHYAKILASAEGELENE